MLDWEEKEWCSHLALHIASSPFLGCSTEETLRVTLPQAVSPSLGFSPAITRQTAAGGNAEAERLKARMVKADH